MSDDFRGACMLPNAFFQAQNGGWKLPPDPTVTPSHLR